MKFLNNLFKKKHNYEYYSIVSETLPVYHDRFRTTNKNIVKLLETDDRFNKLMLEEQNGVPVEFHKEFKEKSSKHFGKHTGLSDFEVEEMKQGSIFEVKGEGFLENSNSVYEVVLVTDRYVYVRNLEYNFIYLKSYKEIKRMRDMNALHLYETYKTNIKNI